MHVLSRIHTHTHNTQRTHAHTHNTQQRERERERERESTHSHAREREGVGEENVQGTDFCANLQQPSTETVDALKQVSSKRRHSVIREHIL